MSLIGTIVTLRISAVHRFGAYLEWGEKDDLFLPSDEQTRPLLFGDDVVVFIEDAPNGAVATMRLESHLDEDTSRLRSQQKVQLLIVEETALGFTAVIDGKHLGVLYRSEVFQTLLPGDRLPGYVKKVRDDRKVDLILQPSGSKGSNDVGDQILDKLRLNGGFLPLTDQSSPELIYSNFGVSKKKFKMALGHLYKRELVSLNEDGIRLRGLRSGGRPSTQTSVLLERPRDKDARAQ